MPFKRKQKIQYDYELCISWRQVAAVIEEINQNGWVLVSVTSDHAGNWTVFFGRPADG